MARVMKIGAGSSAILVRDERLEGRYLEEFFDELERDGFTRWHHSKGHFEGVDWVYVNLNSKLYANGMPGTEITQILGNHAITLDEFVTIYGIYKKYEGKDVLVMK